MNVINTVTKQTPVAVKLSAPLLTAIERAKMAISAAQLNVIRCEIWLSLVMFIGV